MTARIRPTAQDQRDAADLRWLDEHAGMLQHTYDNLWIVYEDVDATSGVSDTVHGIHAAIREGRRLLAVAAMEGDSE